MKKTRQRPTALTSEIRHLRERAGLTVEQLAVEVGRTPRTVYRWEAGSAKPERLVVDHIRRRLMIREVKAPYGAPTFTFIDLFAGIGGMRMGFERVGGECVFTSEWNAPAVKTYLANFPTDHRVAGDINEKDLIDRIPPHDVLVAGFPCQPFSIAGVSKKNALGRPHGFACEAQGTLFFRIAEILKAHRPPAFVLENVKNLKSHDGGNTYRVIRHVLENELGYEVHDRVIDAKSFVPQHRERIFIVGFRSPTAFRFDGLELPSGDDGPRLGIILHPQDSSEEPEEPYTTGPKARVGEKYTLTAHLWQYLQNYADRHRSAGNGFGYGLFGPMDVARTLSARYYKDGSEILIRRRGGRPRRLTPRECSRLMGFDQPGKPFHIPVSDTQAYKQFGNAVVVPVVERVATAVLPHLFGVIRGDVIPRAEDDGQILLPLGRALEAVS
jgi:DNA (cytosine-5)-methyltransferase 1